MKLKQILVTGLSAAVLTACGQPQAENSATDVPSMGRSADSIQNQPYKPGYKLIRLNAAETKPVYKVGEDVVANIEGELLSGCYTLGPSAVEHNKERHQLILSQWSQKHAMNCTQAIVPVEFQAHLGALEAGDYDLTSAEDGSVIGQILVR
jgi:hypothetical protein